MIMIKSKFKVVFASLDIWSGMQLGMIHRNINFTGNVLCIKLSGGTWAFTILFFTLFVLVRVLNE